MLLITNAEIYDGENPQPRGGCVLIDGDTIKDVLDAPPSGYAGETLDAGGRVLCPGFIDAHAHNDFFAVLPEQERYLKPVAQQGITTMVSGNCGHSGTGYLAETQYPRELHGLFPFNPDYKELADFSGWADAADKYSSVNIACLVGHGTVRASLNGLSASPLSQEQLKQQDALIEDALAKGAAGISFGLMYEPGMFAPPEELDRVAAIAKKYDRPLTFHERANSKISTSYDTLFGRAHNLRALDEIVEIGRRSGAKVHFSHVIFVGKSSWSTLDETVSIIDKANASGVDTTFDIYAFDFGASTINVILPAWYQAMTPEQKRKLGSRIKLNAMIFGAKKLLGITWHDLEITYAGKEHPEYIGKRVDDIARELGMGNLKTYMRIIDETDAQASIHMYKYMTEHIIDVLSRHEKVMFMTDAWVKDEGAQNMAAYCGFPRFLRLSREGKAEELGHMICKMTSAPAERFSLAGRGRIKAGCFADLVVFDKNTVCDNGCETPAGIEDVIINGSFVVKDGQYISGTRNGRALRIK